jgi:hypothetical protein
MALVVNCAQTYNPTHTTGLEFDVCVLPKMVEVPVPVNQAFWAKKRASLQSEYPAFIEKYPDADTQYRQLFKVLCTTEDVAGYTPTSVGVSAEWMAVVSTAEENG